MDFQSRQGSGGEAAPKQEDKKSVLTTLVTTVRCRDAGATGCRNSAHGACLLIPPRRGAVTPVSGMTPGLQGGLAAFHSLLLGAHFGIVECDAPAGSLS